MTKPHINITFTPSREGESKTKDEADYIPSATVLGHKGLDGTVAPLSSLENINNNDLEENQTEKKIETIDITKEKTGNKYEIVILK